MRILKLVIWDLDQTILTGVLEEGDEEINPEAQRLMAHLAEYGILQTLATQNQSHVITPTLDKFNWSKLFIHVEADLGPKVRKVRRILEALAINPLDTAFIDDDAFERDAMAVQISGLTSWSVGELATFLAERPLTITAEGRRRPQMYLEQQQRNQAETTADDYTEFLRSCQIQLTIRPYRPDDAGRVEELLTRTHQMNLGVLPVDEAIARLNQPGEYRVIIAEMKDRYGDMGRCGVIHLTPSTKGEAYIESLAISCRTRARGLSLAMLAGLLSHPSAQFESYYCHYLFNGFNRPLRMLLMGANFKPQSEGEALLLTQDRLGELSLPDWVKLIYQTNQLGDRINENYDLPD